MTSPNEYERLGTVIDPSVPKRRRTKFYFSLAALIISLVAAAFTGWQAVEAHKSRIRAEESDRQQAREREVGQFWVMRVGNGEQSECRGGVLADTP